MNDYPSIKKLECRNHPGYYCDEHGNVYHGDKRLSIITRYNGSQYVCVKDVDKYGNNCFRNIRILTLMKEAFFPDEKDIIFKDGDVTNLELSNLEPGTRGIYISKLYDYKSKYAQKSDKRLYANLYDQDEPVYQISPETFKIVKTFNSLSEAAYYYDISKYSLKQCCCDIKKTCLKYYWCYKRDYNSLFNHKIIGGDDVE